MARKRVKQKNKIYKIWLTARYGILYSLLIVAAFLFTALVYKNKQFGDARIDEILFYFTNGLMDGQSGNFWQTIEDNLFLMAILLFILILPVLNLFRNRIKIHFNLTFFGGKSKRQLVFDPSRITFMHKFFYSLTVFVVGLALFLHSLGAAAYATAFLKTTDLYESHYVAPESVKLKFPKQKRNLVYIYLESMENTIGSTENGGQSNESQIPELENLAINPQNVSFSNSDSPLGGALPVANTTWTVAGMTAQMGGIPLKGALLGGDENEMGRFSHFLPGSYMLGDVLAQAGYNQSFIMGSESSFGGRDKLLKDHGNFTIVDLNEARQREYIAEDYGVWWGYEDSKLFEFARHEARQLANQNKPFNLSLLTANTHFVDGYLEPSCPTPSTNQYTNVFLCSSRQVAEFIEWIKQQPFGDNTTIVVSGDHLGMQTAFYDQLVTSSGYSRTIYNLFVNPAARPINQTNRTFTVMDMYPSTLAALGVDIPGDKLGLGTNLFADIETLPEELGGTDALSREISKRSPYYMQTIFRQAEP